jgi:oligoribonuclease
MDSSKLIWLDLEMTGLDPRHDHIIEIATIITDSQLNILAEGPAIAIHQPPEILALMDEWNVRQHGNSGLTARVQASRINITQAEQQTLLFVQQHCKPQESPLCGNSICQDRRFLYQHMPQLEAFFHYRNLDVSTLKELARRWQPGLIDQIKKRDQHLALDDIKDSINELKLYQQKFLIQEAQ